MAAHNLPIPPTALIGRDGEVAAVCALLRQDDVRLLTISGPPGIGKTRLAIAAAAALAGDFAHGVYFVDLAPVTDPGLVLPTLLHALGARPDADRPAAAELGDFLAHKRVLLVLDNFEQVIDAGPEVAQLPASAPHVKLLVTSRELLRVSGEQHFPLLPLALPPVLADAGGPRTLAALSPERLGGYAAVQLFVGRAAALRPDFALTPENALIVAGICCRLDGLPLAIELAAARVRHLGAQDIYERLDARLHLLTGGPRDLPLRQRTLRNTVAWSYNLLDAGERLLLARLAVFRGGCSLPAAEAVCGEGLPLPVLDGLASLVDKSLVQRQETAARGARFRLLELIHEYAGEQLAASGEWETLHRRHAAWFADLAERAEAELRGADQKQWFHLLDTEIDNLRAALEWSLGHGVSAAGDSAAGDSAAAARILSGTTLYWHIYGRQSEGIRWVELLLARREELPPIHRIRLLRSAAGLLAYHDAAAARRLSRQALHSARLLGDKRELAWALYTVGILGSTTEEGAAGGAEEQSAGAALTAARVLFGELNDERGLAQVLNNLGEQARLGGDDARARAAYEASLALFERLGDRRAQYSLLYNLAFVAQHAADHQEAIRLLRRSLALCQELGVPAEVARELLALGGSLGAAGDPAGAARLFGAAEAFLQQSGALLDPNDQPEHDRNLGFVRAALGEAAFAAAWAEGQAMTLEAAAAYALAAADEQADGQADEQPSDQVGEPAGDGPAAPTASAGESAPRSPLTRREREVARLIAAGLSNREIAAALVITERTVEGHVGNILAKLNFRSRAQVAAWYVRG